MSDHRCDTGNFDRTICPEPCGRMHSYCDTCGERQDRCAHDAMPNPTPTLTDEQREELAEVLTDLRAHRDGNLKPRSYYRRWSEVEADALAPLIARMVADAGCELQRTGDGTHGPLIRQAKAGALREAAEDWRRKMGRLDDLAAAEWLRDRADRFRPTPSAPDGRCEAVDEHGLGRCVLDAHPAPPHAWEDVDGPPGPPQQWQAASTEESPNA